MSACAHDRFAPVLGSDRGAGANQTPAAVDEPETGEATVRVFAPERLNRNGVRNGEAADIVLGEHAAEWDRRLRAVERLRAEGWQLSIWGDQCRATKRFAGVDAARAQAQALLGSVSSDLRFDADDGTRIPESRLA